MAQPTRRTTMTKKTKTTKSIIDQLDALCNDVLDNTQKATETLDKSDKKLLDFMIGFTKEACTKYMDVINKYCQITGHDKLTLCIQNISTAAGTGNYLYLKLSKDPKYGTCGVELVWERYKPETLLELYYHPSWAPNNPTVYGLRHGSDVYREKLAYTVQYIKSGRFEQDFVQEVTQACKNRLATNATLTATAKVNNRI
jgi:hypothetical protein